MKKAGMLLCRLFPVASLLTRTRASAPARLLCVLASAPHTTIAGHVVPLADAVVGAGAPAPVDTQAGVRQDLLGGTRHVKDNGNGIPEGELVRPVDKPAVKETMLVQESSSSRSMATKVEIEDAALIFEYAWNNLVRKHGGLLVVRAHGSPVGVLCRFGGVFRTCFSFIFTFWCSPVLMCEVVFSFTVLLGQLQRVTRANR